MVTEIETTFDKLISKLNTVRKASENLKSIKSSQSETQRKDKKENRSFKSYRPIAKSLTYLQDQREKKGQEKIFEDIITENFSKLIKDNKKQTQPAQKISSSTKITPKHIIFKLQD